jgi:DNA-binding NarL/FixJ family response regulator
MRVAIAEDSGFFRDALAESIRSAGHDVIASVEDADALALALKQERPDVAIIDICLPPTKTDEGLVAAEQLGAKYPKLGILVLSAYLAMPHVARLLGTGRGGIGCLAKDQLHDRDMLVDALDRLASGGTVVDPDFVAQQFNLEKVQKKLTERELEMLRAVAEGHSNQRIASLLCVGVKTVEGTLTSIFRKLDIDSTNSNARVKAVLTYLSKPQSFIERT